MSETKRYYKDYSWVVRGKQRREIIKIMDKPKTPTQIRTEANLSLNNVSDILRQFRKKKIARVLNPKEKTGRLYVLENKGKKIKKDLTE